VASAEPDDTATAPAQKQQPAKQASSKTTGGSGYVAQLASFRSQGEAQAEFNRLQGKYPDVLGGQNANISTATVAGSTRYRLGVGPLASRDAAQKICGSLLASGERDCLVRKQ
jgi:cell division septation protein DedD